MRDTLDSKDLSDFLQAHIQVLIAEANEAGFGTEEILTELRAIVEQQRIAYNTDPDPADDPDPDDGDARQWLPRSG
jgi:hypothetical protein